VLGIDPGYATTGYAVIERTAGRLHPIAIGAIRTGSADPHARRLADLGRELEAIVRETTPSFAAVERLFFNINRRTAISVGQASGVALAIVGAAGLEVTEYTPLEVKQSVTGTGTADKHQVQVMVAALLGLPRPPEPADAADACALAICHLNRSGLSRAVLRSGARS
jgi:crossover junction endodeoxyribonuclease RuvC